jgi:hypothetical protein
MLVKTQQFKLPPLFLFNAAASLLFLGAGGYVVRDMLFAESVPQCSERYADTMLFALQRPSGETLTAADLQSRLSGRDWGLLDNAKIIKISDGPAPVALRVDLPQGSASKGASDEPRSGMGFRWTPDALKRASTACLTYNIWLPKDFDFGTGGALPGLYGSSADDLTSQDGKPGFSARYRWHGDGKAEVRVATADSPDGTSVPIDPNWFKLERGQWVRLEEEVVLNTPGSHNGILRVWIDGKMRFERSNLMFNPKEGGRFAGVMADVHYSRADLTWAPSPKTASVLLSPLELRWRE